MDILTVLIMIGLPVIILAGTGMLVLEGREKEFPCLYGLCRKVFYGIGIAALLLVLYLGD